METDFWVVLDEDHPRAEFLMEIFGRLRLNIESPIVGLANLPSFDGPQRVVKLNMEALTNLERIKLVNYISKQFGLLPQEVSAELERTGMPILLDHHATLVIENPGRWVY